MNPGVLRNWVAFGLCSVAIVVAAFAPTTPLNYRAPVAHTVLDTSVAFIGTLIALLEIGRFHRSKDDADLVILLAVILLAWVHMFFDIVPSIFVPHLMSASMGGRVQEWGTGITRVLASWYLLVASFSSAPQELPMKMERRIWPRIILPAALAASAMLIFVRFISEARTGLLERVLWPQSTSSLLQLLGTPLFVIAAWRLSKQSRAKSDEFKGWIATGCVFAGFSMLSSALFQVHGVYGIPLSDYLRGATLAAWAWGAVAEIRHYWLTIAESARREAQRTTALELHDGLAQELALLTSLLRLPAPESAAVEWNEQLQSTAERILSETRQTMVALVGEQPQPIPANPERFAHGASAINVDFGVDVDLSQVRDLSDLEHREVIVRIVREAVANAVRHGFAGHIGIHIVRGEDGTTALRVSDDGIGFDPTAATTSAQFGIISMQEAAMRAGATLEVHSLPGQGTIVEALWT